MSPCAQYPSEHPENMHGARLRPLGYNIAAASRRLREGHCPRAEWRDRGHPQLRTIIMTHPIRQSSSHPLATRGISRLISTACLVGALASSFAFAEDHDRNGAHQERSAHGQAARHGNHGERERHDMRRDDRGTYSYAQPVYVPPPVYYEPPRSPGISLFFPLELR